ncbi:MAG TPA: hypothetical protein EYO76_12860 [Flavobacteriaceae bacterium]|nr:hypothetical protein [Flavobacteriaceae bacterium]
MKQFLIFFIVISTISKAQNMFSVSGKISSENQAVPYANVYLEHTKIGTTTAIRKYTIPDLPPKSGILGI